LVRSSHGFINKSVMNLIQNNNNSASLILGYSKFDYSEILIFVLINNQASLTTVDIFANGGHVKELNIIFI
jgi:hypothetical protein